jgi:hypothetical protein
MEIVPLRHFFPLKVATLIEVLLYFHYNGDVRICLTKLGGSHDDDF